MRRHTFFRQILWTVAVAGLVALLSGCPNLFGGEETEDSASSYTVTYEANGAESGSAPAAQTKLEGVDLTLSANTGSLARTGYTFVGWNSAADGGGTDYAEGATYSADADLTLYARWTLLPTYTVTYNANNADSGSAPEDQTKIEGLDLTLSANSGNLARTGYTFVGWNTASGGSGTHYAEGTTYTIDADLTLFAEWQWASDLSIGDDGPAGGVVFYDKGSYSDGWRYLEAWTADESGEYQWKTSNTETAGTSTDIGSGYENTYSAMTGTEHPAAEVVRNATHGGYTDWFLPSQDGLNEMNSRRTDIGGFATPPGANYWSSSERGSNVEFAWGQPWPTGDQFASNKVSDILVRAARRF